MKTRNLLAIVKCPVFLCSLLLAFGCDNGTTPDKATRWVSIIGLDRIGLSNFKFSVLLSNTDTKGVIYEFQGNTFPDGIPTDKVLKCPLVTDIHFEQGVSSVIIKYKYWHGNGDYYINFIVTKVDDNEIYQHWVSNELIHFSDNSPNPTLSLYDAHIKE
jgi:hypothetical protein